MSKSELPTPRVFLSLVVPAVLALALPGCCDDVPDEAVELEVEGAIEGAQLDAIRAAHTDAEARCEAACIEIAAAEGDELEAVDVCEAVGDNDSADAWASENLGVTVTCTGMKLIPGFCTGRRPQGHREAVPDDDGVGAWLAAHGHLEQASIRAFHELAEWLERRAAPDSLVARCRAAADDEVVHAALISGLAREAGATVPPCDADAPVDDLLSVALHNAVEGCVHEAFASIIAAHQARHARDDRQREIFGRIAIDELRHGQLAWDLHAWLLERLEEDERRTVERAQMRALSRLATVATANARATPAGLGWPSPNLAARMAQSFAALVA